MCNSLPYAQTHWVGGPWCTKAGYKHAHILNFNWNHQNLWRQCTNLYSHLVTHLPIVDSIMHLISATLICEKWFLIILMCISLISNYFECLIKSISCIDFYFIALFFYWSWHLKTPPFWLHHFTSLVVILEKLMLSHMDYCSFLTGVLGSLRPTSPFDWFTTGS